MKGKNNSIECYLKSKYTVLKDFRVPNVNEIMDHLYELAPNEIAMDAYVRKVLMNHLDN